MAERELLVRIIGDDRDLQRALGRTDRRLESIDNRTQTFGRNIGRAFAAAGIAVGTSEVFRLAGDAVSAAADLNEQLSRTRVIMGESAQATIEWSETTATSFGIAQREALAATATFAGLFQTVGAEQDAAAEMSRQLVELSADLASLQNADPSETLRALRSTLAGEAEPGRRFNIFLTEARVNMEALAASGKRSESELTQLDKTMARFNLILRDAAPAIGNFEDTSGELANQTRILRAQLDDLSTNIGNVLVPVLTDAAQAANLLFVALEKFRGVDFSPGFDFPDPPDWVGRISSAAPLAAVSPLGAAIVATKNIVEGDNEEAKSVLGDITGSVTKTLNEMSVALEKRAEALKKAQRTSDAKAARDFGVFLKGLGLKLDRAALTDTTDDDIAALREIERAILRRIDQEGRTFELVQKLTDTRLAIKQLVEAQAEDARRAGEDAFNTTIDALDLQLDMARATRSLADDQEALRALEQAIIRRIATEGQTTDLLRQLFNVREEQKRVAEQLREQARERRQGRQFEALGLTEEGERRTPGVGALSRRLQNLREQIKGTVLDTEKTRRELDRIAEVLSGKFGAVGKEVREAILQMFNDIAGALEEGGGDRRGPLTRTSGLNTRKILAGLGLSPEEINALRGRLAGINSAGQQLAGLGGPAPGPRNRVGLRDDTGANRIFVESHTTINLDGQQVAKVVTKQQQKTKRRNPQQKRGPNRNR